MSRFRSARLSLLASSSLVAVSLTAAALFGVALAPTAALAANECTPVGVDPADNGDAPDEFYCDAGYYEFGVTYDSEGDLLVETFGFDTMDEGVRLTGNDADPVTFDVDGGAINAYENTGPAIQVLTDSGDIVVNALGGVSSVGMGGIRAVSSDGGDVTVTASQLYYIPGTSIEAISRGGDGNVTVTASNLFPIDLGVYAESSGAGALTINMGGFTEAYGAGVGLEAITTGTGLMTINVGEQGQSSIFGEATAIRTDAGGDAVINMFASSSLSTGLSGNPSLDLGVGAGTTTTVNLAGGTFTGIGTTDDRANVSGIRAAGSGALVLNNDGTFGSPQGGGGSLIDLSALTGAATLTMSAHSGWVIPNVHPSTQAPSINRFSAGDDTITSAGRIFAGIPNAPDATSAPVVVDFGSGEDSFENTGLIGLHLERGQGLNAKTYAGDTQFLNLESFTHSGVVYMGVRQVDSTDGAVYGAVRTDNWNDDVLSMPGATWVGDGGEIVFDVNLNNAQSDCTTRNAGGDLQAADCLMLVDGATEGVTYATINEVVPGDRGRYDPDGILLVDVSGSGAGGQQGDFVIGPNSTSYSDERGGILQKGVFFYTIAYDEEDKQHRLVSLPGANAQQFPIVAGVGHSLWRTTTGTWFDRQADLRGNVGDGVGGGVWLRVSGESADREFTQWAVGAGQTYTFTDAYKQTSYAVTGGADVFSASEGDRAYVVGVMAGYAHAELEYDVSPNLSRFDGWTGGVYASLIAGGLFVDAAINANRLDLEDDVPELDLAPAGTILSTQLLSVGGQIEAGWRFPLTESLFVEPLASVSYVRTAYDEMLIPADDPARPRIGVEFDDPTSLRGGVGARVAAEFDYGGLRTQFSMLGRMWNEFEGENVAALRNQGPDAMLTDDFSGQFSEVGLGASIYSPGGAASGFVNLGGMFGDDFQSTKASAGVRVHW